MRGEFPVECVILSNADALSCFAVCWTPSVRAVARGCRRTTQVVTERDAMALVSNPFCVKLFYSFRSATAMYLVMEYMIGTELSSRYRVTKAKLTAMELRIRPLTLPACAP